MTAGEQQGNAWVRRGVYLAYLVTTSAIIYVVGFITTALGALVMTLALVGLGTYALVRSVRAGDGADPFAGCADTDLFRWREVGIAVLACLPALLLPSELTSPMASAVFFALFAVPTYVAAFGWHAWCRWQSRRRSFGATGTPEVGNATPPPGWYGDPGDVRFLRWWDGWNWTPHVQPRPW